MESRTSHNMIILSVLLHMFSILFAPFTEIMLLVIMDEKYKIALVCGILQIPVAIYSGIIMGKNYKTTQDFLIDIADIKNVYSPSFALYVLFLWLETNIMSTWILSGIGFNLEWFVHFFAYLPIFIYFIGLCAGYTLRT